MSAVLSVIARGPSDSFTWADAPLSDVSAPCIAACCYVAVILTLERLMRARGRGFDTKWLQVAHNLILCLASLLMALGTAVEVVRRSLAEADSSPWFGRWLYCEDPQTVPRGPLWYWSYVYYLSKYYELLDTVLQLLKGRPPPHFFLHVYHHAVVLLMAWFWLEYVQTLQFLGLLFNTSVHVVMYYYYFCRVLGVDVWWKRYVTQFQIVQFGCSALMYCVTLALLAQGEPCAGSRTLVFNFVFNMTLLYQFVGVLGGGKRKAKDAKKI